MIADLHVGLKESRAFLASIQGQPGRIWGISGLFKKKGAGSPGIMWIFYMILLSLRLHKLPALSWQNVRRF